MNSKYQQYQGLLKRTDEHVSFVHTRWDGRAGGKSRVKVTITLLVHLGAKSQLIRAISLFKIPMRYIGFFSKYLKLVFVTDIT